MRDHDEIDRLLRESAVAAGVMVIALVAVVASCTSPDSGIGLAATPTSAASKTTAVASQLPSKPPPGTSPPSSTPTAATSALSPSSTVSPAPTLERPSVVNDDDPVVAYGNLFETRIADETLLCPAGGSPPDSTGCHGTVVVTVRGIDPRELPGLETNPTVPDLPGGTWVTQWVRVDGVWADGAFQATRVELAERPSFLELIQMPEVPCDSPTSGCPVTPVSPAILSVRERRLRCWKPRSHATRTPTRGYRRQLSAAQTAGDSDRPSWWARS